MVERSALASVLVVVRWDGTVLHTSHLSPPRSFTLGGYGCNVVLPPEALGAERVELIHVREDGAVNVTLPRSGRGRIETEGSPGEDVADALGRGVTSVALQSGVSVHLELGAFSVEVRAETAVASPVRRWHRHGVRLAFPIASALAHAAALGLLAVSPADPAPLGHEVSAEQVYFMQRMLSATAERELEHDEEATVGGNTEGATGTRAKGEEGGRLGGSRYGVVGPSDRGDSKVARSQAMRVAAEFGMIGLLNPTSAGEDPATLWGEKIGEAVGAGGLGLAGIGAGGDPSAPPAVFEGEAPGGARLTASGRKAPPAPAPVDTAKDRLSTFSIDVDTGSYTIARGEIMQGSLPAPGTVRVEEMLNYFNYGYEGPAKGAFAVHLAAAPSPYARGRHLLRVGLQGKRIAAQDRKPVHLVYLVDTSGSMQSPDRIGLAKQSLKILTGALQPGDTVALCTYAGSVREVLPPTHIDKRATILAAIDDLTASGSTAMASGIDLAYALAERTLVKGHVNRVVVLSDGDANVGPTSHEEILRRISEYKGKGITLSTVGFGRGNYKDTMMEQLADKGDGNYSYIDTEAQARRVFSEQIDGLLEVIARDVKIQVDFDPSVVKEYRLIGYANRDIADKDFRNDKVDAGEVGAGHSVTALYDVVLKSTTTSPVTVRIRHKPPVGEQAAEEAFVMDPRAIAGSFDAAPATLRFAAAVAGFGESLQESPHARGVRMAGVVRLASTAAVGEDQLQFVDLARRAGAIQTEVGAEAVAFAR